VEPLVKLEKRRMFVVIAWSPLAKGATVKEQVGDDPAVKRARTPPRQSLCENGERDRREAGRLASRRWSWHDTRPIPPISGLRPSPRLER